MKFNTLSVVINAVLLIVADALMFVFIKDWTNTMICSLVMIDLAFLLNICSFIVTTEGKDAYIFQASTSATTSMCVVAEIILTVVAALITIPEPYVMVAEILVFIAFALLFVTSTAGNRHTEKTAHKYDANILNVRAISDRLYAAFNAEEDREIKRIIENAYDKSRSISGYSDELAGYDRDLMFLAEQIAANVNTPDKDSMKALCNSFIAKADERAAEAAALRN